MRSIILLALAAGTLLATPVLAVTIEVFVDDATQPRIIKVKNRQDVIFLYNLNDPDRLNQRLAQGLPRDQAVAAIHAKIQRMGGIEVLREDYRRAYRGHILAHRYDLTQYPAVVFNRGEAVVYGVTDLHDALNRFRQWKHGQ